MTAPTPQRRTPCDATSRPLSASPVVGSGRLCEPLADNARALAVQLYEANQRSKGAVVGEYWRLPLAQRQDWERRAERVLASRRPLHAYDETAMDEPWRAAEIDAINRGVR